MIRWTNIKRLLIGCIVFACFLLFIVTFKCNDKSSCGFQVIIIGNLMQCRTFHKTYCSGLSTIVHAISERRIMVRPGEHSWIPHSMLKNPTGPVHLLMKDGICVPYTNYTFLPLTLTSNYILNSPSACANKKLNLIIIVHSAASNFYRRKALRDTWANSVLLEQMSSQHLFLLGKTTSITIQDMIIDEHQMHGDIVQGDFIDDYHNLTHKAVLVFKWLYEICKNAKFVLKVDDDVFLNIFRLMDEILPSVQYSPYFIVCNVHYDDDVMRYGKWAVDMDYFPTCTYYPFPFCNGGFALFSSKIVPLLFDLAHSVPFIWLDDVYVYGILANMAADVSLRHMHGLYNEETEAMECFQDNDQCGMLMAFTNSTKIMKFFWSKTLFRECNRHRKICDTYMALTRKIVIGKSAIHTWLSQEKSSSENLR